MNATGYDVETLCGPEVELLTSVLLYHIIEGTVLAEDVLARNATETTLATLNGGEIVVNKDDLTVNGVLISVPDAVTEPFVAHGIDAVLLPPGMEGGAGGTDDVMGGMGGTEAPSSAAKQMVSVGIASLMVVLALL